MRTLRQLPPAARRSAAALVLSAAALLLLTPAASADGHGLTGVSVQIDNTIEAPAFDFPEETPFGSQGPVAINDTIEFAACCDGFYAVDLTSDRITMRWIGADSFERVIEPGTYDRYYFTFGEPVLAGASLDPASTLPASVQVVSPTEMLVEIGPGLEIGDGFDVAIDVRVAGDGPAELAFTGADTARLAVVGSAVVAAGAMLVRLSRRADDPARVGDDR